MSNFNKEAIANTLNAGFVKGLKEKEQLSPVVLFLFLFDIHSIQFQLDRTEKEWVEAIGVAIGYAQYLEQLDTIMSMDFPSELKREVESFILQKRKNFKYCRA